MKKTLKKILETILSICCCICLIMMCGEAPGYWQLVLTIGFLVALLGCGKLLERISDSNLNKNIN